MKEDIRSIQEGIRASRYANEAAVSAGIVRRLLDQLGWPVYETDIVAPEFSLEGRRVDYALCHPASNPLVFVEVKQIGKAEGADRQLFEYAFYKGVPMAVLTDGQEWHFFLPAEQGDFTERRVYKLDLLARELEESVQRLKRYLDYAAVCSGTAFQNARDDFKDITKTRQIQNALPQAWATLLDDEDDLLLELIAEKVESLCGYKPDAQTVATFLGSIRSASTQAQQSIPYTPPSLQRTAPQLPPSESRQASDNHLGFELDGRFYRARSALDILTNVLVNLSKKDPSFLDRFAAVPKQGRKRRYVDRMRDNLYPGRPDLARDCSKEFLPGWWLGTNLSRQTIEQIIKLACEVANVPFGRQLKIWLR